MIAPWTFIHKKTLLQRIQIYSLQQNRLSFSCFVFFSVHLIQSRLSYQHQFFNHTIYLSTKSTLIHTSLFGSCIVYNLFAYYPFKKRNFYIQLFPAVSDSEKIVNIMLVMIFVLIRIELYAEKCVIKATSYCKHGEAYVQTRQVNPLY